MSKLLQQLSMTAVLTVASLSAQAAGLLEVTVVEVNDKVVTVQTEEFLPSWIQEGATVTAAGWPSTVKPLQGQTLELHFDSSQQDFIKPDTQLTIRGEAGESDGITCG